MSTHFSISRSDFGVSPSEYDKPTVLFAPHAGGSSSAFAHVRVQLLKHVNFIGVAYPGRGFNSFAESPSSVEEMATHVISAIDTRITSSSRELTLWGYSVGALVMIEVASRLLQRGWPRINHVLVTACLPPHLFSAQHLLVDDENKFLKLVSRLGGGAAQYA